MSFVPFILISYPDFTEYLLYTLSFVILEEVHNFKSLASYKHFAAEQVLDVGWWQHGTLEVSQLFRQDTCHTLGNLQVNRQKMVT